MSDYENTTKRLRKINDKKGPGWAAPTFVAASEAGMFVYGVQEVIAHPLFWVVVWKIAKRTLGGGKQEKTTFWQRVDKE